MEIGLFSLMAGVLAFGMWLHSYLMDAGLILKYKKVELKHEFAIDRTVVMQSLKESEDNGKN